MDSDGCGPEARPLGPVRGPRSRSGGGRPSTCRPAEVALLRVSTEVRSVTPDIRTIEFTPEDTEDGEITPEWLMGVAEGLQEDRDKLPPGSEITRVEITVEVPE